MRRHIMELFLNSLNDKSAQIYLHQVCALSRSKSKSAFFDVIYPDLTKKKKKIKVPKWMIYKNRKNTWKNKENKKKKNKRQTETIEKSKKLNCWLAPWWIEVFTLLVRSITLVVFSLIKKRLSDNIGFFLETFQFIVIYITLKVNPCLMFSCLNLLTTSRKNKKIKH